MAEVIDGFVEKRLRESIKRSPVRGEIKIPREGDGDIHLRSVRFLSDFFKKNGYEFGYRSTNDATFVSYQLNGLVKQLIIKNA